ncbi:MAG: hypothetical protein KK926_01510 [Methanomethylovorans sp.]|nr:hypothetical protein [Methanomethylovorans sp.]
MRGLREAAGVGRLEAGKARVPGSHKEWFSLRGTTLCVHCGEKSRESRIVSRKIKHQNQILHPSGSE